MKKLKPFLFVFLLLVFRYCPAQILHKKAVYTQQDTLRGSITPGRDWWDVSWYGITVKPDYTKKTIEGKTDIQFKVLKTGDRMQIDLQLPMQIKKVNWNNDSLPLNRDGNAFYVRFPQYLKEGSVQQISILYSGKPREAVHPPWDGGWIWKTDKNGNPWMSVACQGLGASVWYPCKDHQSDEPDSAALTIVVPDDLVGVGNGRLSSKTINVDGTTSYTWTVKNPINNYNIIPYIGKYANWTETIPGENGNLDCSYWVLDYNMDKAKQQFKQVQPMIKCFEQWFGPYPFYEDGYKLVESPHLGMEHQSAVAYGNNYENGYLGKDLSASGWGLKWDFIIIHESGHEWFGNNITAKDIGDMWIHESFTNYSETIFTGYQSGKEAGNDYVIGTRKAIENKTAIIGPYGVNREGSGDMYYKGGNMIHTIRTIINNDDVFKNILRGMNKTFYHQTVTAGQIEEYITTQSKIDFTKVFDQYLRNTAIPVLEYRRDRAKLLYRWSNCIKGFNMPVKVSTGKKEFWIKPTEEWKSLDVKEGSGLEVDRNFYVGVKKIV